MPYDLSALNHASFNELNSSLLLSFGDGLNQSGDVYVASPNGIGLANYDNWLGTLNSGPQPSDIASVNTFIPAVSTPNVLEFTYTLGDGSTTPNVGGIGAELVATNSTGYLFEELSGYQPGPHALVNPNENYFILTSVNIATLDADGNFVGESATPAQLTFFVPEPSTAMLMPLMVVALMVSRLRAVRSFLGAR